MDVIDDKKVTVCWNCNPKGLNGKGLKYNFNWVKNRLGDTAYVYEINTGKYPYQELGSLFENVDYSGWILLECSGTPGDKIGAMIEQREAWD